MTAKLNNIDPQAWLADVLARIAATSQAGSMSYSTGNGRSALFSPPPDRITQSRDYPAALTEWLLINGHNGFGMRLPL